MDAVPETFVCTPVKRSDADRLALLLDSLKKVHLDHMLQECAACRAVVVEDTPYFYFVTCSACRKLFCSECVDDWYFVDGRYGGPPPEKPVCEQCDQCARSPALSELNKQ
jgi:hypothetical protein